RQGQGFAVSGAGLAMHALPAAPSEMTSIAPWSQFLAALVGAQDHDNFTTTLAALLTGEPRRLFAYGNGPLVNASEFNFDLLRAIITTISGRFGGGLGDALPDPSIRFHPALHSCDLARLAAVAEREPGSAFFVVGMDCIAVGDGWQV